jgi:2,4-diketo-3-deoxy-L-fuconate hydrolase
MGTQIVRFRSTTPSGHRWALLENDRARPIEGAFETTKELIELGMPALRNRTLAFGSPLSLKELELLSPITHPCRVIAQATNYGAHVREVGLDPKARASNVLFRKSSAAISGVVGLVIGNDVSARDVQVPDGQFYKGKSYRTFCPLGPYLYVPEPAELSRWPDLELTLCVNGEVRQSAVAGEMIHRPAETLTEIMSIEDLEPGDVILTGTPGGVALAPPKKPLRAIAELLPESVKWRLFIDGQAKSPRYLQPGDRITATIRTPDGYIDLGTQDNLVR